MLFVCEQSMTKSSWSSRPACAVDAKLPPGHKLPAIFSQSYALAKICTFVQLLLVFCPTIMLEISPSYITASPVAEWEKSYGYCPPTRSLGVAAFFRHSPLFFDSGNSGCPTRDFRPATTSEQNHAESARAAGDCVRKLSHGDGLASDPRGAGV